MDLRAWEENRFTAEGRLLHQVTNEAGQRKRRGVRRVTALPLACRRLDLGGVADLVEFHQRSYEETAYPVEYERERLRRSMLVLVTYDVRTSEAGGATRLRRVAKACRDYGQRVQYSVFEIDVDPAQWTSLRAKLENLITPEHDSLRYYFLGANWRRRVEHVGAKPAIDLGGPLIV